ncbi:MAG: hypothetical protein DI536_23770 [Archangium gephyra]|uniref:Uncharacterized protein n=1 Tax=Archangium gephyra TaxID=48 RepID=A0A2W5T0R3_9BACT|nr:MAG: hypothetical protein DI536_23770 [Archangium gephyra]
MWLALLLAAFPIPTIDGKAPASAPEQAKWTLPMRFEKVKKFYVEEFKTNADVKLTERTRDGHRELVITTRAPREAWTRAVVTERAVDVSIEVTRVMRLADEEISGTARPLVEFVFTRSPEIDKAVKSIDHTESMRAK